MRKNVLRLLGLGLCLATIFGCATVMKGGDQKIYFQSDPSGAKVSVYDVDNRLVADGKTPITLPLAKGASYFQPAKYRVVFEATGRANKEVWLSGSMESGWYIVGNFFIGGLIGWLIVDPLTGAMWNLKPSTVDASLEPKLSASDGGLRVVLADQVPAKVLDLATPVGSLN